ncbi:MAG: hypothetical protein ACOXZ7_05125 [Sphaerochaeta sp.]
MRATTASESVNSRMPFRTLVIPLERGPSSFLAKSGSPFRSTTVGGRSTGVLQSGQAAAPSASFTPHCTQ